MADSNNGCYIVAADGTKIPIRRDVVFAFKRFYENKLTGSVTVDFKSGGVSAVSDKTVYQTGQ